MNNRIAMHYQKGLTLIEIMIAMLIGLFLLGGLLQIFTNSKQTFRVQDALSQLQESGSYSLATMADDIRMAGYYGCNSQVPLTNDGSGTPNKLNTPTNYLYDFAVGIQGHKYTGSSGTGEANVGDWTPSLDTSIGLVSTGRPNRSSDILTIRRARDTGYTVTAQIDATTPLSLASTADFDNCDLVLVENCQTATVFQVTSTSGNQLAHSVGGSCTPGNSTNDTTNAYPNGQVHKIDTIYYYVEDSNGVATLYREVNNHPEPLIEGVTKLVILYGVDTDTPLDGAANYYVTADAVTGWNQVVSIRITVTTQTLEENISGDNLTNNGKISRDFTSTIAIRNRLL